MGLLTRNRLAAAMIVLAVFASGCGGGSGGATGQAGSLAARAERVAAALEVGACDQARAEALALQSDVGAVQLDPAVKAEAADRTRRLVAAINCPPPTTTATTVTTTAVVAGEPGPAKGKKHKGDHR